MTGGSIMLTSCGGNHHICIQDILKLPAAEIPVSTRSIMRRSFSFSVCAVGWIIGRMQLMLEPYKSTVHFLQSAKVAQQRRIQTVHIMLQVRKS